MAVSRSLKPSTKEYLFKILCDKALLIHRVLGLILCLGDYPPAPHPQRKIDMGENRTEKFLFIFLYFPSTYLNRLPFFLLFKSGEKIR